MLGNENGDYLFYDFRTVINRVRTEGGRFTTNSLMRMNDVNLDYLCNSTKILEIQYEDTYPRLIAIHPSIEWPEWSSWSCMVSIMLFYNRVLYAIILGITAEDTIGGIISINISTVFKKRPL